MNQSDFGVLMTALARPVVVVTVTADGEPRGMTAASFTPLSWQTPLIAVNIAAHARTLSLLLRAEHFAINILTQEQIDLAERFSQPALIGREQFQGVDNYTTSRGILILDRALGAIECRRENTIRAVDHTLVIGEVTETYVHDRNALPLVAWAGQYCAVGKSLGPIKIARPK
jgi:flavin reductase (DIM6/NTAB) family NADH-FMN oxidoreductase RutF